MNCDGVRARLSAYVDGELSPGDLLRVEQHLRRCHGCADEVDSLRQAISLVATLDEVEIPAGFHAKLHDRLVALGPPASLHRIPAGQTWQRSLRNWALPAAAAAAVLAVGLSSVRHLGEQPSGLLVTPSVTVDKSPQVAFSTPDATEKPPVPVESRNSGEPKAQVDPKLTPSVTFPAKTGGEARPRVEPPTPAPIGDTKPTGLTGAYTVSYLNGVNQIDALPALYAVTYQIAGKVADPSVLTSNLLAKYSGMAEVNAAGAVIKVPAKDAAAAMEYIKAQLGQGGVEAEPIKSDVSSSIRFAYARLKELDSERERKVLASRSVTDQAQLDLAKQELELLAKQAKDALADLDGLQRQIAEATIIVTVQKQAQ